MLTHKKLKRFFSALRQIILGAALGSLYEYELEMKKSHNILTLVILFGDGYGLPIFPTYYRLRILPHLFGWFSWVEKDLLEEKTLTDRLSD
ncbi:MAG: hypothetical protein ACE5I5_04505 [Candidatus Heimdallarchaeota archaeon]